MTNSLKAYREKRDFNVTTEPAGGQTRDESASMSEALDEGKVKVFLEGRQHHDPYALSRTVDGDKPRWLWLQMKDGEGGRKS